MDQQHDLPRHRRRVRRRADRAALPRARDRRRAGRAGVVRAGAAAGAGAGDREPSVAQRSTTSPAPAGWRPRTPAGSRSRGERRRRAGDDEPVRRRPAVAGLPAADDVARSRRPARRDFWSTPSRRSRSTPAGVSPGSCARRSTWARARSRSIAQGRRRRRAAVRRGRRQAGVVYTRTGGPFFADTGELVDRLRERRRPLFESLDTDWLALDCELLPWSAKALDADQGPVRLGRCRRPHVLPEVARLLERPPSVGSTSAGLAARVAAPGHERRCLPRCLRGTTSDPPTGSTA